MERLIVLIAALSVAIIAVGGVGYFALNKANTALQDMYSRQLKAVQVLNDARAHARKVEADTYAIMLTTDPQQSQSILKDIENRGKIFDQDLKTFDEISVREESKQKLQTIRDDAVKYRAIRSRILSLSEQNKKDEAYALFDKVGRTLSDHFTDTLYDLANDVGEIADETYQTSQEAQGTITKILVLVIVAALVFGLLFGIILAKQIDSRLQDVVGYLEVLAEGDFSKEISLKC